MEAAISAPLTYVESDIERSLAKLEHVPHGFKYHVYCSPLNAGALELIQELMEAASPALAKLKVCTDVHALDRCDQMLVYLREDTWHGDAFAD